MMEECENQRPTSRRSNKPLMEKRRRQRINNCLGELKTLVLQALKKDTTQYSKLEKADILEMTVKHLKMVQRQQMAAAMATDPNVISRYRAGFNECATEVVRYLDTTPGGSPELKQRVLNHLAGTMTQIPVVPLYQTAPQMTYPGLPVHVQIPQTTCIRQVPAAFSQGHYQVNSPSDYFPHSQLSYSSVDSVQSCSSNNSANYSASSSAQSMTRSPSPIVKNSSPRIPSPERHAPSPCDSDSGLSDISAVSYSKDEIARVGQFNLKNSDDSLLSDRTVTEHQSLKSSLPILQESYILVPKSERTSPARAQEAPHHVIENIADGHVQHLGSMWRPW